ncbi:MAG: LON peptidase substrate-binding domain-containing protein [Acidobacteriota bacterium]|nr:LON peptidase substrate-binding domain-containing protein [Acidobacteriota bacterium]
MSDALDKVRGARELALFPLPVVLFPGVPLPLHVFEERYRRLLADVRASNNLFGLPFFNGEPGAAGRPPVGCVGCVAEVVEAQPLPDGRSNILTVGVVRFRLESYVEAGEPYLVARVEFFEDEEEDAELLAGRAGEVVELFKRIGRAVRALNDDRAALPELPEADPERLSFLVAAAMDIDDETKQGLLELRSSSERLARLGRLLSQVVGGYEERARLHKVVKGNGHAGRKIDLEE